MTVTAQVIATKPNCISLLVHYDGGVATTLDITNAELAAAAPPGQFRQFLQTDWAGNNQANARLRLLGNAAPVALGGMAQDLSEVNHCRVFERQRGVVGRIAIDGNVDGADADRVMIQLACGTQGGLADDFQVDLEYQHSRIR